MVIQRNTHISPHTCSVLEYKDIVIQQSMCMANSQWS